MFGLWDRPIFDAIIHLLVGDIMILIMKVIFSIIGEKPGAKNFFPYSLDQFTFFKTITWRHF